MKKILFLLLSVFCFTLSAQENKDSALAIFNRGLDYYNNNNFDSALITWRGIVEKGLGKKTDVYGITLFNIPTLYWTMGNKDSAKVWYKKVLASDIKDSDETGSLMEPHTNYKHKSALALAGLYGLGKDYTQVIYWIDQADTTYRYWGYEGSATSVSKEQAYMLNWKTSVLMMQNRNDEALRGIVTELICAGNLIDFFSYQLDSLQMDYKMHPNNFKKDFSRALDSLTVTKINESNWRATFVYSGLTYTIPISNSYPDKNIPHYWRMLFIGKNETPDAKFIAKKIREGEFGKKFLN